MIKGKIKNSLHPKIGMEWKNIEFVLSNDEEPAIGTRLLQGSVATLDFVKNKLVIAEPRRKS